MEEVVKLVEDNQRFAITTHVSPEGDAIGSELALRLILKALKRDVVVVNQSVTPHNLLFLPGTSSILSPRELKETDFDLRSHLLWFVLDCGNFDRVGSSVARLIRGAAHNIINIDHHHDNPMFGDVNYVAEVASTAQLIYELANALNVQVDKEIATCIYTGIVADTDAFRNANVNAEVMEVAALLLAHGANSREVTINLYERRKLSEAKLLGHVLLNAHLEDGIGWSVITREMFAETGTSTAETERVVEELRTLEGIEVAVLFKELEDGRVKVSFRSKGGMAVNEVARLFGGGGHESAAGCVLSGELYKVEEQVIGELKRRLNAEGIG